MKDWCFLLLEVAMDHSAVFQFWDAWLSAYCAGGRLFWASVAMNMEYGRPFLHVMFPASRTGRVVGDVSASHFGMHEVIPIDFTR